MKYLIILTLILSHTITKEAKADELELIPIKTRVMLMKETIQSFETEIQNRAVNGIGRYYIGADNSCDFSTIQQGVNATIGDANAPELLIASNKTYDENIVLQNIHMFMDGDYSTCSDARNGIRGGNRALITGAAGSTLPIIRVQGGSFNYSIIIKNFRIQSNNATGVQTFSSSATILLEDILFSQLTRGAIKVQGTATPRTNVMVENSFFLLNSSIDGGAISCSGTNNLIALENSPVVSNNASGKGGGVYLDQACDFSMVGGGIENNTSGGNGAGIYAEFGSDVELQQTSIKSNLAGGEGGGIYAQFSSTTISAISTNFSRNKSDNTGGAIALRGGASFTIKRTDIACNDNQRCNFFDKNEAAILGGAIYNNDSNLDISSTYFENNRADFGTAIYSIGANTSTVVEGSIFSQNGDNGADGFTDLYVVRAINNAILDISYSTFADNKAGNSTFGVSFNSSINLQSSIVYDFSSGNVFDIEAGGSLNFQCLMTHETDSFDIISEAATAEDPMFLDAANGNYHLDAAISPAVDYCTNAQAMPNFKDIDYEDRGFDDVLIPNNNATNGTYDIGADETQGSDIIFKDGFEL